MKILNILVCKYSNYVMFNIFNLKNNISKLASDDLHNADKNTQAGKKKIKETLLGLDSKQGLLADHAISLPLS